MPSISEVKKFKICIGVLLLGSSFVAEVVPSLLCRKGNEFGMGGCPPCRGIIRGGGGVLFEIELLSASSNEFRTRPLLIVVDLWSCGESPREEASILELLFKSRMDGT